MSIHYIAMAGLSGGYMPNYCGSHETRESAIRDLVDLHGIGKKKARELKRNGYVTLSLSYHGNEYAEIQECDCEDPEQHND